MSSLIKYILLSIFDTCYRGLILVFNFFFLYKRRFLLPTENVMNSALSLFFSLVFRNSFPNFFLFFKKYILLSVFDTCYRRLVSVFHFFFLCKRRFLLLTEKVMNTVLPFWFSLVFRNSFPNYSNQTIKIIKILKGSATSISQKLITSIFLLTCLKTEYEQD